MCCHCEDTGLLEIQILLCFTTAYLQVDPAKIDQLRKLSNTHRSKTQLKVSDHKLTSYLG